MRPAWQDRLVETVRARTGEPGWRDALWLRASAAADAPLVATFAEPVAHASPSIDEMPFRIASVTKVYVAAAIFRLIEDDLATLDAPIGALLATRTRLALRQGGYDDERITVEQLLRHTSGLRDHSASETFVQRLKVDPAHRWTRAEQLGIAIGLGAPLCEPGLTFHYSDSGYLLLGEIVERLAGAALPLALPSLLGFESLGLTRTAFDETTTTATPAPAGPLATQWLDEFDATALHPSFDLFGGGGLVSTLAEVDRFFRALFGGEVFARPETLARIFAAEATDCGFGGFGHNGLMFRATLAGLDCWGHTGFWGVVAAFVPARDAMLAATFNRSRREGAYDADRLLGDFASSIA